MCGIVNTGSNFLRNLFLLLLFFSFILVGAPKFFLLQYLPVRQDLFVNYFAIVAGALVCFLAIFIEKKFSMPLFMLALFSYVLACFTWNPREFVFFGILYFIPMLIVAVRPYHFLEREYLILAIRIFNIFVVSLVVFGVIDYIFDRNLGIFISTFFPLDFFELVLRTSKHNPQYRSFTVVGHPLVLAQYLMFYVVVNFAAYWKGIYKPNLVNVITVSVVGVLLANSKVAIVILALLIVFFVPTVGLKKFRCFMFIVIISIFAYGFSPVANYLHVNIESRFLYALQKGDISNGRLGSLHALFSSDQVYPNLILPMGRNTSRYITDNLGTVNFENPLVMFSYDYGITVAFILFFFSFIFPLVYLITNRHIYLFIISSLGLIFPFTFNGLTGTSEIFFQLILFGQILVMIAISSNE